MTLEILTHVLRAGNAKTKAVPSNIFVSRKLDLEKPTRQSGKKKRGHEKKRTVKSYRKTVTLLNSI